MDAVNSLDLSIDAASKMISALLAQPRETVKTPISKDAISLEQVNKGSYWTVDGNVARVRISRSSGRLYAEVLRTETNNAGETVGRFEYIKGAVYALKTKMTMEEAKAWGATHGLCCVCAKFLSDPKSVEAGIGPVCAKKV